MFRTDLINDLTRHDPDFTRKMKREHSAALLRFCDLDVCNLERADVTHWLELYRTKKGDAVHPLVI